MSAKDALFDVIEYEGPSDILVWKHGCEDFNAMTQLVVHESQEAVLIKNGQMCDSFGPGRYTLESQNIPLIGKMALLPTNGQTPFHCEVYFINKAAVMDLSWGTNTPVPFQDPNFGIILPLRANGQFSVSVKDGRRLLVKLVGTVSIFAREEIARCFKGIIMTHFKQMLVGAMREKRMGFLDVNGHLLELSQALIGQIRPYFEEYGLALNNFFVGTVSVPEDDPGYVKIREALADGGSRSIQGYTYQDQRAFDVAEAAAKNEGTIGTIAGAGMGMGMGVGIGVPLSMGMASVYNRTMQPIIGAQPQAQQPTEAGLPGSGKILTQKSKPSTTENMISCPFCSAAIPAHSNYCLECGKLVSVATHCPKCAAKTPGGSKYCPDCGQPLQEGSASP